MALDILLRIVQTKKKGSNILTLTWSDSKKEEESNNDDESENFTAFMISNTEITKTSLKAFETEKSYELDSTIGFLKEDDEYSNEEHKSELRQTYNQLYKQSYKLADAKMKLRD